MGCAISGKRGIVVFFRSGGQIYRSTAMDSNEHAGGHWQHAVDTRESQFFDESLDMANAFGLLDRKKRVRRDSTKIARD